MSLRDLMNDDLTDVLLDTEDYAEKCTYLPDGGSSAFDVTLAVGDAADQMIALASGRADQMQIGVTGKSSTLRAVILAKTGQTRDPIHGDTVSFASGDYAGTWMVLTHQPDQGGGTVMQLRFESHHEAAGRDVAESR